MKKKLVALALISALAVSALSLAACGSDFKSIYENPYENEAYAQLVEQGKILDSKKDLGLDLNAGNVSGYKILSVFTGTDGARKVYNFDSETVVKDVAANTETVTYDIVTSCMFVNDAYYDYFYVKKGTKDTVTSVWDYEYSLYNADGSLVATSEEAPYVNIDTIFMDSDYYRINKEGVFAKAGSRAKNAADLKPIFGLLDEHYYAYDNPNKRLFVYDTSYALTNYYELPSYATLTGLGILNDGNVLIQYRYNVSNFDNDYTYFDGANNVKVITQIYNVKNGNLKDVETVGLFGDIIARDIEAGDINEYKYTLDSGIKNVAEIQYITNKRLDTTNKTVALKNDGSVDFVLNEAIAAQDGAPNALPSGKYMVGTKFGAQYLVDKKGNVIADVTGASFNGKYIVVNSAVYDYDFNELATFDEDTWGLFSTMNNSVVLHNITDGNGNKYRLFADGVFKDITLNDNQSIDNYGRRYYVIKTVGTDGTTYTYYNENGVALHTSAFALTYKGMARNGKVLFNGYDTANTKYVNVVLYTAPAAK